MIARFWRWWMGELGDLAGPGSTRAISPSEDGGFVTAAGAPWRGGGAVELMAPEAALLRKRITLPEAAEPRLADALRFELARHTPFAAEEVDWSWRAAGRDPEAGTIAAEIALIPRARAARMIADAEAHGRGGRVTALRAAGFERPLRVIGGPRGGGFGRVDAALVALAAVGIAAALIAPGLHVEARLDALRPRIEAARAHLADDPRPAPATEAGARLAALVAFGFERPPAVVVLETLSQALPDDAHIGFLTLRGPELGIEGAAASTDRLIQRLEASGLVRDVAFASPTQVDAALKLERFHLTMTLVGGVGR